jgi:hypothetical protein
MRYGVERIDNPKLDTGRADHSKAWQYADAVEHDGDDYRWYQIAADPDHQAVMMLGKMAYQHYGPVKARGLRFRVIQDDDTQNWVLCVRREPDAIEPGAWDTYLEARRARNRRKKIRRTQSLRGAGTVGEGSDGLGSSVPSQPSGPFEGFSIGEVALPDFSKEEPE